MSPISVKVDHEVDTSLDVICRVIGYVDEARRGGQPITQTAMAESIRHNLMVLQRNKLIHDVERNWNL